MHSMSHLWLLRSSHWLRRVCDRHGLRRILDAARPCRSWVPCRPSVLRRRSRVVVLSSRCILNSTRRRIAYSRRRRGCGSSISGRILIVRRCLRLLHVARTLARWEVSVVAHGNGIVRSIGHVSAIVSLYFLQLGRLETETERCERAYILTPSHKLADHQAAALQHYIAG